MLNQDLENKRKRGDNTPFYVYESSSWNDAVGSYFPDKDKVWVSGIYKKDLVKLGAKIITSRLGGHIGFLDGFASDWFFLISREDCDRILKEWVASLGVESINKKPTLDDLKDEMKKRHRLISIPELSNMIDGIEETDSVLVLRKKISEYKYMNIDPKSVLIMIDNL